jgi:hypothetical protein
LKKTIISLILSLLLISCLSDSDINNAIDLLTNKEKLDTDTIIAGLKEALEIGTKSTVKIIGKKDGYFKNQIIKIILPEELQEAEKTLRSIGLGYKVDEFILSMNRAAEKAAPQAIDIFAAAIKNMTIEDAKKILYGNDNKAATKYFEKATRKELFKIFKPVIKNAMDSVGQTSRHLMMSSANN